jgi:hypothetical protein
MYSIFRKSDLLSNLYALHPCFAIPPYQKFLLLVTLEKASLADLKMCPNEKKIYERLHPRRF